MATTRVSWDQTRFDKDLGALRKFARPTVRAAALASAMRTAKHAHDTKFIEANPPFLNRDTGRAARSITASPKVQMTRDAAIATWGSNVGYVLKHERGGTYREWIKLHKVRAHTRIISGFQSQRHAGAFLGATAAAVGSHRTIEVKAHFVRGHYAMRHYRRRAMIATAAREFAGYPAQAVRTALLLLIRDAKTPTANQVIQTVGA